METITGKVRAMYESYPYPTRVASGSTDCFPQLCMSLRNGYKHREQLAILDAGCGTGGTSVGTAMCNPTCRVVAVDNNRGALAALREEAVTWGVGNLEVQEIDLNTLEGLHVPDGGFDFIICGGVIHHLADPVRSLQNLADVLAPDGVMRLMVYNTMGRQALYRFVNSLDLIHKDRSNFEERIKLGRRLMAALRSGPIVETAWKTGSDVDDVEFVDRYLNLHDTSYSVGGYMDMLQAAGLEFLRWYEPQSWNLESYLDDPALLESLVHEPDLVKYQLVEHISNQVYLDAYVAHAGSKKADFSTSLETSTLSLNPEACLQVSQQSRAGTFHEVMPRVFLRGRHSIALEDDDYAILSKLTQGPLPASTFLDGASSRSRLLKLLDTELLYGYTN